MIGRVCGCSRKSPISRVFEPWFSQWICVRLDSMVFVFLFHSYTSQPSLIRRNDRPTVGVWLKRVFLEYFEWKKNQKIKAKRSEEKKTKKMSYKQRTRRSVSASYWCELRSGAHRVNWVRRKKIVSVFFLLFCFFFIDENYYTILIDEKYRLYSLQKTFPERKNWFRASSRAPPSDGGISIISFDESSNGYRLSLSPPRRPKPINWH